MRGLGKEKKSAWALRGLRFRIIITILIMIIIVILKMIVV